MSTTNRLSSITGSAVFGTSSIKTDECFLIAQVSTASGRTVAEATAEISFIDDCISMRRMVETYGRSKSARLTATGRIRKNSNYMDFVERRLDGFMEELDAIAGTEGDGSKKPATP
jgi:hypothetical protein